MRGLQTGRPQTRGHLQAWARRPREKWPLDALGAMGRAHRAGSEWVFRKDFLERRRLNRKKQELASWRIFLAKGAQARRKHEDSAPPLAHVVGAWSVGCGEQALTVAGLGRPAKVFEHPLASRGKDF